MKLFAPLLLSVILILMIGCSSEETPGQVNDEYNSKVTIGTPSQVYDEYNSKVIDGIKFNDDKAYYSKRKQAEVESKFPEYMKNMDKSREEVIESYLDFWRELAKCKELELVSEVIDGDGAILKYSQTDICGNATDREEEQLIRMINEDGWKIDDVVISI